MSVAGDGRAGAGEAVPKTADCCSRSPQIFSKADTSTQRPEQFSHSRIAVEPSVIAAMSALHRGHFNTESSAAVDSAAAAPQCGQCLLPMNIIAKHDGHAIVASFDSQYRHLGESEEIAAPQFGQLRVSACITGIVAVSSPARFNDFRDAENGARAPARDFSAGCGCYKSGLLGNLCAMLALQKSHV